MRKYFMIEMHYNWFYYRNVLKMVFYNKNALKMIFYYKNILEMIFTIKMH